MALTKIQEGLLRQFIERFDCDCYFNKERITVGEAIDIFKGHKITESVNSRKEKFRSTLKPFIKKYGKDMLIEFGSYWSEMLQSGTRMRWEDEKTWEVDKRLARWYKKNCDDNNQKTYTKSPAPRNPPPTQNAQMVENKVVMNRISY